MKLKFNTRNPFMRHKCYGPVGEVGRLYFNLFNYFCFLRRHFVVHASAILWKAKRIKFCLHRSLLMLCILGLSKISNFFFLLVLQKIDC